MQGPNPTNMALFRERIVNRPKRRLTLAARNVQRIIMGESGFKREFLVFSGARRGSTSSNGGMLDH